MLRRICENCGKIYFSSNVQKKYCSDKCRNKKSNDKLNERRKKYGRKRSN